MREPRGLQGIIEKCGIDGVAGRGDDNTRFAFVGVVRRSERAHRVRFLQRASIAACYVLASLLAVGGYGHGGHEHEAPEALASCEDGGLHLAPHSDAPDLSHDEGCAACQVRHATALVCRAEQVVASLVVSQEFAAPSTSPLGAFGPHKFGRAPPRA